jgi:hypothetical protein
MADLEIEIRELLEAGVRPSAIANELNVPVTWAYPVMIALEQEVREFTGREPTQKQIEKFFRGDIKFMYFSQFEDGLADSVEAHFG